MNPHEDIGQNQFGMYTIKLKIMKLLLCFIYIHIYIYMKYIIS